MSIMLVVPPKNHYFNVMARFECQEMVRIRKTRTPFWSRTWEGSLSASIWWLGLRADAQRLQGESKGSASWVAGKVTDLDLVD